MLVNYGKTTSELSDAIRECRDQGVDIPEWLWKKLYNTLYGHLVMKIKGKFDKWNDDIVMSAFGLHLMDCVKKWNCCGTVEGYWHRYFLYKTIETSYKEINGISKTMYKNGVRICSLDTLMEDWERGEDE